MSAVNPFGLLPPDADRATVDFVLAFCDTILGDFGVVAVYLFGSRATGISRSGAAVRENSDHDFLVVLSDSAPPELITGQKLHSDVDALLQVKRREAGLGKIDFLIQRQAHHTQSATEEGSFAYNAVNGHRLA